MRWPRSGSTFDLQSDTGQLLRIDVLTPGIVRLRMAAQGQFARSVTQRWGYVRDQWHPVPLTVEENAGAVSIETLSRTIRVQRQTMQVDWLTPGRGWVLSNRHATRSAWYWPPGQVTDCPGGRCSWRSAAL